MSDENQNPLEPVPPAGVEPVPPAGAVPVPPAQTPVPPAQPIPQPEVNPVPQTPSFDTVQIQPQYSMFECHLETDQFERLWANLNSIIDPDEDRIVAYLLDAKSAARTLTAGTMICTEKVVCYVV